MHIDFTYVRKTVAIKFMIMKRQFKMKLTSWVRWLKPVIPALREAKEGGSRGQEITTILVNMVKPRLY